MNPLIPPAMQAILAAPPLVPGEDEADYQRMVAQLGAESGAATSFDWMQVKDIADLTWQIARTRRWVSAFIASRQHRGLADGVRSVVAPGSISEATHDHIFRARYDHPVEHANASRELLAELGLPADQVGAAHVFFDTLKPLANAEELLMRLELRRDRAIAQIEARRRAFGVALRAASNRVVEVDAAEPPLVGGLPLARADSEPSLRGA
jgi:hypothetical protein